jgi:hypothetical protein
MIGLTITGNPIATLAVGASSSAIKEHTPSQADIDAGKVVNTSNCKRSESDVTDVSGTAVTTILNHYSLTQTQVLRL